MLSANESLYHTEGTCLKENSAKHYLHLNYLYNITLMHFQLKRKKPFCKKTKNKKILFMASPWNFAGMLVAGASLWSQWNFVHLMASLTAVDFSFFFFLASGSLAEWFRATVWGRQEKQLSFYYPLSKFGGGVTFSVTYQSRWLQWKSGKSVWVEYGLSLLRMDNPGCWFHW